MSDDDMLTAAGSVFLANYQSSRSPREAMSAAHGYLLSLRKGGKRANRRATIPDEAKSILARVCLLHATHVRFIVGPSRAPSACAVRDEAAWLILRAGFSTTVTGWTLNRDHSTVIAARDRFDARLAMDPGLRERMAALVGASVKAA